MQLYPEVVDTLNPLAHWRLGELTGTVAVDETGNHDGTYSIDSSGLTTPGLLTNDSDTAIILNGIDQYFELVSDGHSFSVSGQETNPYGLTWNTDGSKFFVTGFATNTVYEYTVSSVFDLSSTVAYSGNSYYVGSEDIFTRSIAWNNDGTKFYIIGAENDYIREYTVSIGFDLSSTVAYSGNGKYIGSAESNPQDIKWNNDGSKLYVIGGSDFINEYSVSINFDISSTITYVTGFSVSGQENGANGLAWNNDGTKFYIIGSTNDTVFEYTVSIGFDLSSTVAYSGNSYYTEGNDETPTCIAWNNDGTKFYITGDITNTVYEYTVSVGFDLSSVVDYSQEWLPFGTSARAVVGSVKSATQKLLFTYGTDTAGNLIEILTNATGDIGVNINGANIYYTSTLDDNIEHHYGVSFPDSGTLNDIDFYVDDALLTSVESSLNPTAAYNTILSGSAYIGRTLAGVYYAQTSDDTVILGTELTQQNNTDLYTAFLGQLVPLKGQINITGGAVVFELGTHLYPSKGLLNIVGNVPVFGLSMLPSKGQINITGGTAFSNIGANIHTSKGQININGINPVINIGSNLHTSKGQINIAGKTPLAEIVLKLNLLESIDVESIFTEEVFIIRKVVEQLFVTDIITTHHNGTVTITDSIAFKDRLYFIISELLTESITNTDILTALHTGKQSITETISLTDIITTQLTMKNILVDVITIVDLLIPYISIIIKDSITVSDSVNVIVKMITEVVDSITVTDTVSPGLTLVVFASDSITLTDVVSTKQIFNLLVTEEVVVYGDIVIDNEHYTFVMNTKTKGISEYTDYNFNSMSEGLAANSTGIYLLEGDDDTGTDIDALIKTGLVDFGSSLEKQIPYAYIGLSKSGGMVLKTLVDYRGTRKEYWYDVTIRDIGATDTIRVPMGKGVKSRYWGFELTNKDGSDFELDSLEMMPLVLKRRI